MGYLSFLRLEILNDQQVPAGVVDFYFSLYGMSKLRELRLLSLGSASCRHSINMIWVKVTNGSSKAWLEF